ncbi:MAG: RNA 2',3'-cyclic phosphodiesterase [Candidatus Nanopelagicales bacterium]
MRLFSALVPPPAVLDAVGEAVELARSTGADLRWTGPDQWHLTLGFYANVETEQLAGLSDRLGRVARRHEPLELLLAGGGRFDGRVLWLGVRGDREPLRRLASATVAAAAREGIALEDRTYRPHLTVARSRRPTDLRRAKDALTTWASPPWPAGELTLFRSHLGAKPWYEVLHTWRLGKPVPERSRLP